jgi:hypothetical protein
VDQEVRYCCWMDGPFVYPRLCVGTGLDHSNQLLCGLLYMPMVCSGVVSLKNAVLVLIRGAPGALRAGPCAVISNGAGPDIDHRS